MIRLVEYVGRTEAWGTDLGARVFARLNVDLMGLSEGTLVPIDFAGLERSDVSFQREAVVETIRKHRPRLLFVDVEESENRRCRRLTRGPTSTAGLVYDVAFGPP